MILRFVNGILDNRTPAEDDDENTVKLVPIDILTERLALWDSEGAILPPSYTPDPPHAPIVPLASVAIDFGPRLRLYDVHTLRGIIASIRGGAALPPISVHARGGGRYLLLNGFHRFFASAVIGFSSIPVNPEAAQPVAAQQPQPPQQPQQPARPKWVSKTVARKMAEANQGGAGSGASQ